MKANLVGAMHVAVTRKFTTLMGYQFAFTMTHSHQKKGQDKNNVRLSLRESCAVNSLHAKDLSGRILRAYSSLVLSDVYQATLIWTVVWLTIQLTFRNFLK